MTAPSPFDQIRQFLKDMFQFEEHDLDFGIYRITRMKRQFIQAFIDGEDENSLHSTVSRALGSVQDSQRVIPPFLVLTRSRGQAARANFCLGVMPPRAIFGRS
jgi:hypothetical protein